MVRVGELDAEDLPTSVTDPGSASNATTSDDVRAAMQQILKGDPTLYDAYKQSTDDVHNQYVEDFGLYQRDDDQVTEFFESETWGRP